MQRCELLPSTRVWSAAQAPVEICSSGPSAGVWQPSLLQTRTERGRGNTPITTSHAGRRAEKKSWRVELIQLDESSNHKSCWGEIIKQVRNPTDSCGITISSLLQLPLVSNSVMWRLPTEQPLALPFT